jgi:hypothetical protein
MTYQEALDYLNSCEKYGVSIGYDIDDLTHKQIIKLATEMSTASEAAADSYMETQHEDHTVGGCFECTMDR